MKETKKLTFSQALTAAVGADHISRDESMAGHTTFRIGGPADYLVTPVDAKMLYNVISVCRDYGVDYTIIGNGSNLLVGDLGYRGVVISICKTMSEYGMQAEGDWLYVEAGAGIMLAKLARHVSDAGYTGFEYATGIPGTLGGGIAMNAGAYGGEIKDACLWVEVLDEKGDILRLAGEEMDFAYRHSIVMEKSLIVVKAAFGFMKGDQQTIDARVQELAQARRDKQPLEYPSAGSTFKRPVGYFAGKLIQDCGLKGYRVGDAQVSEKHSGFVVNVGNATAADVCKLMSDVSAKVRETYGVELEAEVRMIGSFKGENE